MICRGRKNLARIYSPLTVMASILSYLLFSCFSWCLLGCSTKLTRDQANKQINQMLSPHRVGRITTLKSNLPLPSEDRYSPISFDLVQSKADLEAISPLLHNSKDDQDYLTELLAKAGYVTVKDGERTPEAFKGTLTGYHKLRFVSFTSKAGSKLLEGDHMQYASGFSCASPPNFDDCETPDLLVQDAGYEITGITQDDSKAKVNVLLPWRLTLFALSLQPYVREVGEESISAGHEAPDWVRFLDEHAARGKSSTTVLFQKFDDGWRIVDENGKSEKDWAQ